MATTSMDCRVPKLESEQWSESRSDKANAGARNPAPLTASGAAALKLIDSPVRWHGARRVRW